MPGHNMNREQALATMAMLEEAGGVKAKAARDNGLAPTTFKARVDAAERVLAETIDEEPLAERERRSLQDEINRLRRENRECMRSLNRSQGLRESIFELSEPIDPKDFRPEIAANDGAPEIPVLLTSDFQWGEHIDMADMGGLNAYDPDIASDRYRRLITTAVELCTIHHSGEPPPKFYYLRGGDAISGEIHEELARTNRLSSIPALKDLAEHEAWGIDYIINELECEVVVISTPGNHDRTTLKPQSKRYVETSFDSIISWYLESHFRDNDRVTFLTPREPDALFKVYNTQFLLTHGDQIGGGGGQGFLGPVATITRGMKKVSDYYANIGTMLDVILVGHFHTSLKLDYGFSNGSLPGYSEYARKYRMKPNPPMQWLLHVHPSRGVVSQREIMVGGEGEGILSEQAIGLAVRKVSA